MALVENPKSALVPQLKGVHLFHFDGAPCAQRVRFALIEKGLARGREVRWNSKKKRDQRGNNSSWVSRQVSLIKKDHLTDEYAEIHPHMVVPALVHDGRLYLESMEIVDYVDDTWPGTPLKPRDPALMDQVASLVDWGKKLHVSVRYVSFHWGLKDMAKLTEEEEQHLANLEAVDSPEKLTAFYTQYDRDEISADTYLGHLQALEAGYAHLEALLSDGRPFLIGDQLTMADIIWSIKVLRIWECGYPFKRNFPKLFQWYRRIQKRPGFRDGVMGKHKLLSRFFRMKALFENLTGQGIRRVVARKPAPQLHPAP